MKNENSKQVVIDVPNEVYDVIKNLSRANGVKYLHAIKKYFEMLLNNNQEKLLKMNTKAFVKMIEE